MSGSFSDVDSSTWYSQEVQDLAELGIIQGYPDDTYKPENYVNRAELAVLLDRLLEHVNGQTLVYTKESSETTIHLSVGDKFAVKLNDPSDGGYDFMDPNYDDSVLAQASKQEFSAFDVYTQEELDGNDGYTSYNIWTYRALEKGETDLEIEAERGDEDHIMLFLGHIVVE